MNIDFIMNCNMFEDTDTKEWDFECTFTAKSEIATKKYGNKPLGLIRLSYEPDVINYLVSTYNVPITTVVLDFVTRLSDDISLKGIGMTMLCSILKYLKTKRHITHVYLVAKSTPQKLHKLIELYKSFGFTSLPNDQRRMIANIENIKTSCIKLRNGKNIPLLIKYT